MQGKSDENDTFIAERNVMHPYTLVFIRKDDDILMINREHPPWLGSWNGLGGKIRPNETPDACIRREIIEETGEEIPADRILFRGTVTWNSFDAQGRGLYVYVASVTEGFGQSMPRPTDEGILDWKPISWIMDSRNTGVASNIPHFLPSVLGDGPPSTYHCVFDGNTLVSVTKERGAFHAF